MRYLIFLFCFLNSINSFSQDDIFETEKPFIEVFGTAVKEVIPDKIYVEITLKEKTVNKKAYLISEQEAKLKNIVQSIRLEMKQLKLSNSYSTTIYKRFREKGVRLTKEYILEVSNTKQLNDLFINLNTANIKDAEIIKTEHSKIIELRKEVRIEAIKAAKTKAEYLLSAIEEELGKPIEIREVSENQITRRGSNSNIVNRPNASFKYDAKNSYDINFKPIEIKFSYYVKYEIK